MKIVNTTCPRCGSPARHMIGTFKVRVEVDNNMKPTGKKVVGKPVASHDPLMLECSGGHQWSALVEKE